MGRMRWGMVRGMLGCLLWIFVPGIAVGQWHSGGTLHAANGVEWQQADASNRLATAADMVAAVVKEGGTNITSSTVEDVRPYAEQLAACITAATQTRAAATLPVQDIAALCVVSLQWQGK
jgi:hypothetical protein